jgi:hypothetical protein
MLAICALILALARPLVGGWLGWNFSGSPDTIIILLDRSASMGVKLKNGDTLLTSAISKICEAGIKSAPDAEIILIDSATIAAIRIPSWNTLPDLNIIYPTNTTANIPAMFKLAIDQLLKNDTGKSEIWVASDLQRSNWNATNSAWKNIDAKLESLKSTPRIRLLALGEKNRTNRTISFVAALRHPTTGGREIREITYEIHSPTNSAKSKIPLLVGNVSGTRQIVESVTPGTCRLSQKISSSKNKENLSWGFIKLPPDANTLDNTIFYAFGPPPKEKAIVVSDHSELATIIALAAAPGNSPVMASEVIGTTIAPSTDLDDAAVIIIDFQPNAKFAASLRTVAEKGTMVIFLPPHTPNTKMTDWGRVEKFAPDKEMSVTEWNHDDGILSDPPSGDIIPLNDLKILKRAIPVVRNEKTAILAFYSDGQPFLTREKIGKGAFYRCSTLPIASWSNLGNGLVLVPMERRLMKLGAARFAKIKYEKCGGAETHSLPNSTPNTITSASLTDGSKNSTFQTQSPPKTTAGVYLWEDEVIVVNTPSTEMQNTHLSDAEIATLTPKNKIRLFHANATDGETMQAEIWRVFIIAVLLALIAESFLTLGVKVYSRTGFN